MSSSSRVQYFCCRTRFREALLFLQGTRLIFSFFSLVGVCYQYSQLLDVFLLFKRSKTFLTWSFCSLWSFTFLYFPYHHRIFFNAKFHFHILAKYFYFLYQGLQFVFIFLNETMTSIYIYGDLFFPMI